MSGMLPLVRESHGYSYGEERLLPSLHLVRGFVAQEEYVFTPVALSCGQRNEGLCLRVLCRGMMDLRQEMYLGPLG